MRKNEPPIQNIPLRTEIGKKVREAFLNDRPLVEVDYTAIERRPLEELEKNSSEEK